VSVYVDNMKALYGRMHMCHMIADTRDELFYMADQIGVARKWLQRGGTAYEHFDICKAKRLTAVRRGAQEVTTRDIGRMIHARRAA
jgi:hypothetical protein